jgi:GTP cyclohydrolase I
MFGKKKETVLRPVGKHETAAGPAPSFAEAEEAVRVILRYIGENPARPGLLDTPARVVRAWEEWCEGYKANAADVLNTTFEDIEGYDQPVVMRNIDFISHCEHHMAPMPGKAHIAYWPKDKVVGISKLARVVDVFADRLQSQENLTREVAQAIDEVLAPKGVAIYVEAAHGCMTTRGVGKPNTTLVTTFFTGCFASDMALQAQILATLKG